VLPLEDRMIDGDHGKCNHRINPLNCPSLRFCLSVGRQQLIENLSQAPASSSAGASVDEVQLLVMANQRHPCGPPMALGNMRAQGVRNLIGYCLNNSRLSARRDPQPVTIQRSS
jgi:hypothetical protein